VPLPHPERSESRAASTLARDYELAKTRYSRKYTGYDLSRRIFAYLIGKGYRYDDIHHLQEKEKL
jgi:SOS response regulatory protein OraA/RecX